MNRIEKDIVGIFAASPSVKGYVTQTIANHLAKRMSVFRNWEFDDESTVKRVFFNWLKDLVEWAKSPLGKSHVFLRLADQMGNEQVGKYVARWTNNASIAILWTNIQRSIAIEQ